MKHHVFSIYDNCAKAYLPPFHFPRPEMAKRAFGDCANDPGHNFCVHAQDYVLYQIGVFDDSTGQYENLSPHINHGLALAYKRTPEPGLQADLLNPTEIRK